MLHLPLSLYRSDRKTLALGAVVAAGVVAVALVVLSATGLTDPDDPWGIVRFIGLCSAGPLLCYFAFVGLFLRKETIDRDPALRAFLAHAGLRSMLQLRLVGALFLLALVLFVRLVLRTR